MTIIKSLLECTLIFSPFIYYDFQNIGLENFITLVVQESLSPYCPTSCDVFNLIINYSILVRIKFSLFCRNIHLNKQANTEQGKRPSRMENLDLVPATTFRLILGESLVSFCALLYIQLLIYCQTFRIMFVISLRTNKHRVCFLFLLFCVIVRVLLKKMKIAEKYVLFNFIVWLDNLAYYDAYIQNHVLSLIYPYSCKT